MNEPILLKGTLVYITSYGPIYGRTGTIRAIDIIGGENEPSSTLFYLVALQDEPSKTFWLEHDAVEACAGELLSGSIT
jgi:hypothetical protein